MYFSIIYLFKIINKSTTSVFMINVALWIFNIFFLLFIYLFYRKREQRERERERKCKQGEGQRERESQSGSALSAQSPIHGVLPQKP